MKKLLPLIVLFALILTALTGCRERLDTSRWRAVQGAVRDADGRLNVTTTNFPPFDFIREIAGDRVNLSMLLPPGAENHSFEPSPRDIITMQNSGLFIYTGGESDMWVDRILGSMNTDTMRIFSMINAVEALEEEIVEGMEAPHRHDHDHHDDDHHDDHHDDEHDDEHDDDHYHDEIVLDEHVWTSPKNAILIVRALTETLSEIDPANAGFYRENAAAYIEALQELDAAFEDVIAAAGRRTIVFGDRFPFRYLAHDYGLEYFAAFPGCSTQTEPSAATVAFLINKIRAEQIPVVFHVELSNERMADTISSETGAGKLLLHAAHNITRADFDAGVSYLEIMHRNVVHLRQALQ